MKVRERILSATTLPELLLLYEKTPVLRDQCTIRVFTTKEGIGLSTDCLVQDLSLLIDEQPLINNPVGMHLCQVFAAQALKILGAKNHWAVVKFHARGHNRFEQGIQIGSNNQIIVHSPGSGKLWGSTTGFTKRLSPLNIKETIQERWKEIWLSDNMIFRQGLYMIFGRDGQVLPFAAQNVTLQNRDYGTTHLLLEENNCHLAGNSIDLHLFNDSEDPIGRLNGYLDHLRQKEQAAAADPVTTTRSRYDVAPLFAPMNYSPFGDGDVIHDRTYSWGDVVDQPTTTTAEVVTLAEHMAIERIIEEQRRRHHEEETHV